VTSLGAFALGRLGRGSTSRVELVASGPFATSHVLWRDQRGALFCTVVAKTTFELRPGEVRAADEPLPIHDEDAYWDDDPTKSLRYPSDLAPFKRAAEVVVVGSVFASNEAKLRSIAARVVVGSVDKTIAAWGERAVAHDGTLGEPVPLTRLPLRYELARGGVGTENPVGVDPSRSDAMGGRAAPQLLPAGLELRHAHEFVPVAGLGPVAPSWPNRSGHLSERDREWLSRPAEEPRPSAFPAHFFQAAPVDQWLDRPLSENERILLEGLHDELPRLVSTLAGPEARAWVVGASGEPVRLEGDLLVIDTDRALVTLTARAALPIDERTTSVHVLIFDAARGERVDQAQIEAILERAKPMRLGAEAHASVGEDTSDADPFALSGFAPPAGSGRLSLPFDQPSDAARASRPSLLDRALPFRSASSEAAPSSPSTPPSNWLGSYGGAASASDAMAAVPSSLPVASAPDSSTSRASASSASGALPSNLRDSPLDSPKRIPDLRGDEGDHPLSAKSASDVAARGHEDPSRRPSRRALDRSGPAPLERRAMVDLLAVNRGVADRVRTMKAFAGAFARPLRSRPLASPDVPAPLEGDRDRADVLRVLSYATPFEPRRIRRAWEESFADSGDLEPPLVLVAGDLRPTYDEFERLRATLGAALPVAGGDKRLVALCATAEELLAKGASVGPDAAVGLARQIEQASASMPIPPRYVAREAERALLEGRRYKRRTLLGSPRIRCDFGAPGEADTFLFYAPDIADSLPLLPSFPVIALCEVRPREDLAEPAADALFAVALGRVLRLRGDG
jgi:hypothetical protein